MMTWRRIVVEALAVATGAFLGMAGCLWLAERLFGL